jgi:hypothetical protein
MDKAEIVFYKYSETREFEKNALPFAALIRPAIFLGKLLHRTYKAKGLRATLTHAAKYRNPTASLAKGVKNIGAMRHGAAKSWGVREMGNIAHNLSILGRGVTRQQSAMKNFAQASKNIVEMGKGQVRAAKYKVVSPDKLTGGVLKGKSLFGIPLSSSRKVVGTAGKNVLIKKRAPMRGLSYAMTAPGFAATDVAFTKGGIKERAKAGAKSYALWGVSPAIGTAAMLLGK